MEVSYDENERVLYLLDEESRQGTEAVDVKTCRAGGLKLVDAGDPAATCGATARRAA